MATTLATVADVEARLGRPLTTSEEALTDPGLLEEASALVLAYLGCDPTDPDTGEVPEPVSIVTSRMVARVLRQEAATAPGLVGATSATDTAGPFSQTRQYPAGITSGAPWTTAADKAILGPYQCAGADGKAYEIDTVPATAGGVYGYGYGCCGGVWWP